MSVAGLRHGRACRPTVALLKRRGGGMGYSSRQSGRCRETVIGPRLPYPNGGELRGEHAGRLLSNKANAAMNTRTPFVIAVVAGIFAQSASVRAQNSSAKLAASDSHSHKQTKITLSSIDQAQIQEAAHLLVEGGHPVTLTVTRTEGGSSQTWSFNPASAPVFSRSVVSPTTSVVYSVTAIDQLGAGSGKSPDASFDCARWALKLGMKCTFEITE